MENPYPKLGLISIFSGDNGEKIYFSHDKKNNLYINGKKVKTEKIIELRWFELLLLSLTTLSIITQAVMDVLEYFKI